MDYKLTYSTMFDPPPALHERFEAALARVRAGLGADARAITSRGADQPREGHAREIQPDRPRASLLGRFPDATGAEVGAGGGRGAPCLARAGGARASPSASASCAASPALIEERVYDIAAAVALEVGKNRMEALGEVQETADFFTVYCDDYERQKFDHALPDDPLTGYRSHNRSVMKPYGVWAVITPFNFPFALAGGPVAAALVTGNTVVLKGGTDTPWSGRLLADCLRDAGVPPGVFNYVNGSGSGAGEALVGHPGYRRHHLHRLPPRRHADLPPHGRGRRAAALHRRDGRQEPGDRHGAARTSSGRRPASSARHSA